MTRKIWLLMLVLAAVACRASDTPAVSIVADDPAPQASDLTVDQLIAKYVAARGGEQKLRGLHALRMTGKITTVEIADRPVLVAIAPGRYLRRIEQDASSTLINAVDGATGWEVSPRRGVRAPTPMSAQDTARFQHLADPQGPLFDSAAKGDKIEMTGRQPWRDTQVYKLKVTFRDGGVNYYYLDARSFLPVRIVSGMYIPPLGRDIAVEFGYRDFRAVDGVQCPFAEEASAPEVSFKQTISWDKVEVNPPLDESLFKMPAN
jgi:hypothetical protein